MATPEFILRQRELVGTMPLWLSGVTAVVLRDRHTPDSAATTEEVLLVRHSVEGLWAPVAGIIDPGEHPYRTAEREVAEEAGITAAVERLSWVTVTDLVTYDNGDQTQYIDHVFRCRWVAGEPRPDHEETIDARFFPVDELPALRPDHAERIRAVRDPRPETRLGPYPADLPWSGPAMR